MEHEGGQDTLSNHDSMEPCGPAPPPSPPRATNQRCPLCHPAAIYTQAPAPPGLIFANFYDNQLIFAPMALVRASGGALWCISVCYIGKIGSRPDPVWGKSTEQFGALRV